MNTLRRLAVLSLFGAVTLLAACNPFTKIKGDPVTLEKLNGSWAVIYSNGTKLEGMEPRPILVFNTALGIVSGYDGCNRLRGTFTFEGSRLKAKAASTRMACRDETARRVSASINDLLNNGAEVVELSFGKGHVLVMRNGSTELRLGPNEHVR